MNVSNYIININNILINIIIMDDNNIYIENIIEVDINSLDEFKIMEYQMYISFFLKKALIQYNENLTETIYLNCLYFLDKTSKMLATKINQIIMSKKNTHNEKPKLYRSSYNFCLYSYNCSLFYNLKKNKCNSQHFVHNLLNYDINNLIDYLLFHKNNNLKISNEQIKKTIKTIFFVIKHMYKETQIVNSYSNGNFSSFHKNNKISFYKITNKNNNDNENNDNNNSSNSNKLWKIQKK